MKLNLRELRKLRKVSSRGPLAWLWCRVVHTEDGGRMGLRNVGIQPQHYTASQPRRPRLEISSPQKASYLAHVKSVCIS